MLLLQSPEVLGVVNTETGEEEIVKSSGPDFIKTVDSVSHNEWEINMTVFGILEKIPRRADDS